jgi:transposase-like protein
MEFRYNGHKAGIKEKILEYTLNSSGVRDISRLLQINKNTVMAVLKKNAENQPLPGRTTTNKHRSSAGLYRRDG